MTTNRSRLAFASILALLALTNVADAQRGGRGGGGMVGRGGGGGFRGGGNFSRPEGNQNFNRAAEVRRPEGNQNFNRAAEVRRPEVNQNFNRSPEINRANVNTNVNRPINANNNNVVNNRQNFNNNNVNVNNVNRGGYNAYGLGHGVGPGGYGGWGGNRGYGSGYYGNAYYGAHPGWVNGAWGGRYYPGWGGGYGGGYGGYYGNYFGSALGIGAGIGIASWGLGSLMNNWGYSSYSNPYYGGAGYGQSANFGQSVPYDYSQQLNLASVPPSEDVMQTADTTLDSAREAFRAGDYTQALALADRALAQTPNDPILHEFRATCLFAMRRYDEAAVPFYTVLSVGPGWDWTTMIGLYPDIDTYTSQLRALEAYCNANPRAASARFVLGALYLTQGSTAAAATRLREVVAIQPQDKLSAQLLEAINAQNQPAAAGNPGAPPQPDASIANAAPAEGTPAAPQGPPLPTGPVPANLIGIWSASPGQDSTISLTLGNDKSFNWKYVQKGVAHEFKGEASFDNDILALVAPEMPPMVAKVTWKDPAHFNFKAVATPADDPGLNFGK